MPLRIAVVGPGRLGCALARRWHEAGLEVQGVLGRDAARCAEALAFIGTGRVLGPADLAHAAIVAVTVADPAIDEVAGMLAARVRPCALVFHVAGSRGRDALAPCAERGARTAAMHPLLPAPDRDAAYAGLPGRFALLESCARGERLLALVARRAGLVPWRAGGAIDRDAYHAGCALAANGATALVGAAATVLQRALALPLEEAAALAGDLAAAAAGLAARRGPAAALSGPVVRGDAALIARHLAALARLGDPATGACYRTLMQRAIPLARAQGTSAEALARIGEVLAEAADG